MSSTVKEKCEIQFVEANVPDSVKSTIEKKVKHIIQRAPHLLRCSFAVELPRKSRRIKNHFKVQVQVARKKLDRRPVRVASVAVHEQPGMDQGQS